MTEKKKKQTLKTLRSFGLIDKDGFASEDFADMIACREACRLYWGCAHTGESPEDLLVVLEGLLALSGSDRLEKYLQNVYNRTDRKSPGVFLPEDDTSETAKGYGERLYWAFADLLDLMESDEMEESACENTTRLPF